MVKLTRFLPLILGVSVFGCQNGSPGGFEESAIEVEESRAALTAGDSESAFAEMDGYASSSSDDADTADESVDESAKADSDAGVDEGRSGVHDGRGRRHFPDRAHRGSRPRGRGHGVGLLVWYADLDALKVCQDLRNGCTDSEAVPSCRDQVKECVKPVLEAAFKSLCDERIAECDASSASDHSCTRIRNVCSADAQSEAQGSDGASGDDTGA